MSRVVVFRASPSDWERLPIEADSLDDATLQTGHGVYTVMRLYEGRRVFRLDRHWARLRQSAEMLGAQVGPANEALRGFLRRAVDESGLAQARVRIAIPFDAPEVVIISLEPFTPPSPELIERGAKVALIAGERETPLAKNSAFIEWRKRMTASQPPDIYETLLVDHEGIIREGVGSNFYAVIGGVLRTAEAGMLEGIARGLALEAAAGLLPIEFRAVRVSELSQASEAMITSASRGVVPVVKVGDTSIDGGKPGPVSKALRSAYDAKVEAELEIL